MPLDELWNSLVGGKQEPEAKAPLTPKPTESSTSGGLDGLWKGLVGGAQDKQPEAKADLPPQGFSYAKSGVTPQTSFNTDLGGQEPAFRSWVQQNKVPFDPEAKGPQDYDMRGFYRGLQSGDPNARQSVNPNDSRMHYSDYWKTPYHKSFSAESQWANPETAPHWTDGDKLVTPDGKVVFDEKAQKPRHGNPFPEIKPEAKPTEPAPGSNRGSLDGLWKGLLGGGDPEAKGAAEASKAMEPAVTDFAKKGIAGELGVPSGLERLAAPNQKPIDKATDIALSFGPGTIGQVGKDVVKGIEKILSPTTVDPTSQAAEALIRKETGTARRQTEIANAQVDPFRAVEMPHLGEFNTYIAQPRGPGIPPPPNDPGLLKFIDFVEGRSKGAAYNGPPEMRPVADMLQKLYTERKMAIAAEPTTSTTSFVDDYYAHQWVKAGQGGGGMGRIKQGSGASLKQRDIPTIREGLEEGLTPITASPIETTMHYIQNMDRYLATNRVFSAGLQSNMIQRFSPGRAPDGWVKLNGRLSDDIQAYGQGNAPGAKFKLQHPIPTSAYAPEGFARIYNNFIDPGFGASPMGGAIYNGLLRFTNTLTAAKLGFSAYHGAAMAQESAVSGLAKSFGEISRGELQKGLKDAGYAITILPKMTESTSRGTKLQKQYLEAANYGPEYQKIADLLAKGGGRPIGRGAEYRGSAMDNYFQAWKRGTAKAEMGATLGDFGRAPIGTLFREYGRIMDTVAAPLFDQLIPKLKTGAYFDEMSSWLRQNPAATAEQQLAKSRELIDVMDDRFGEMIMDNIFWNKRLKQSLQLMATSVGWELGSARALGGGAKDLLSRKWSPRTRWLLAFPVVMATSDAVYQYLKTGKQPQGAQDLIAPQTGGKTPEGAPERAILPGYEKDVLGVWQNVGKPLAQGSPMDAARGAGNLLYQKRNPAIQLGTDLATGKDWQGKSINPSDAGFWQSFGNYAKHIGEALLPIPAQQTMYKGTNIGRGERFFGPRPAPGYIEDPKRSGNLEKVHKLGEDVRALSIEIRDLERQGRLGEADKLKVKRKDVTKERNDLMKQLPKPRAQLDYFEGRGYGIG